MMNEGKECFETLAQMKAAKSALNSLINRYLTENLQTCLLECQVKGERDAVCKKFFDEIISNS